MADGSLVENVELADAIGMINDVIGEVSLKYPVEWKANEKHIMCDFHRRIQPDQSSPESVVSAMISIIDTLVISKKVSSMARVDGLSYDDEGFPVGSTLRQAIPWFLPKPYYAAIRYLGFEFRYPLTPLSISSSDTPMDRVDVLMRSVRHRIYGQHVLEASMSGKMTTSATYWVTEEAVRRLKVVASEIGMDDATLESIKWRVTAFIPSMRTSSMGTVLATPTSVLRPMIQEMNRLQSNLFKQHLTALFPDYTALFNKCAEKEPPVPPKYEKKSKK